MKTYSFKVVVEPDEDAQGHSAWYAYCPALESVGGATSGRRVTVAPHGGGDMFTIKTLQSMIESQARWTEEDLKRLKLHR